MKKIAILMMSALLVVASLVTGVFAKYTTTLDAGDDAVIAKRFQLETAVTDNFDDTIEKIAPSETVTSGFSIANYNGEVITEVDMQVVISLSLTASEGKVVTPLVMNLYKGNASGEIVGEALTLSENTYTYTIDANDESIEYFVVEISWPENDATDVNFEGNCAGTYAVSVTGSQIVA